MMKNFIQLQPLQWRKLYDLYNKSVAAGLSKEDILSALSSSLSTTFHTEVAAIIAGKVYDSFSSPECKLEFFNRNEDAAGSVDEYSVPEAQLSLYDIKLLKEKTKNETSIDICKLLVSFLVCARANPHPSNWIKYDRKVIMMLSSLTKKKVSEQTVLTNTVHNLYNINMRVVGSTQPIPCFNIEWHDNQPPVNSPENPLVDIGPLSPETITKFVTENLNKTPTKGGTKDVQN